MRKCKNCIHEKACKQLCDVHKLAFGSARFCDNYKDKSQFVDISYEAVKLISCMVAENHIKEAEKQGFLRVKINAPKPKDIELYLTWDTERKVGEDNIIMLVAHDKEKNQANILFSTNEPVGIQNITEILKEIK